VLEESHGAVRADGDSPEDDLSWNMSWILPATPTRWNTLSFDGQRLIDVSQKGGLTGIPIEGDVVDFVESTGRTGLKER